MSWNKLLNPNKLGNRLHTPDSGRSAFHSDYDKIVFSGAFRRLAKKTQVHPLATNDHIHNRLTHSLEVSCVGRSLGARIGEKLHETGKLPTGISGTYIGDIVQAACIAHDIGNPPFGHTGEDAIRHWFEKEGAQYLTKLSESEKCDLTHFEGNAQGLRVLTTSEYHPYDGGMRLTYATLASFIKYPWTSLPSTKDERPKNNKYGVFQSELEIFDEIATQVGLTQKGDHWYSRHPLVYLMEAADDFCYGLLDLEDGLEMGILQWDEVFDILRQVLTDSEIEKISPELTRFNVGRRPPLLRGKVIDAYISAAAETFIQNEDLIMIGEPLDLISLCPERIKCSVGAAKKLAKEKVFVHPRKIELEIGSYNTISTLLEVMCEAAIEFAESPESNWSFKSKRVIDLIGRNTFQNLKDTTNPNYLSIMRIIDFISGMTDNYATFLARQFKGMGDVG